MREHILITNDDGIGSRGLEALIEVAKDYGDVTVVAPEKAMSGMSHSITMTHPLLIRRISVKDNVTIIACDGTPADCVKVAIDYILEKKPTLLLSGINHGSNSNISVIYSGTMGAAREGAICGIPSIGFSLTSHDTRECLETSKKIVRKVLDKIIPNNKNPKLCLNVNIPTIPYTEIKGIKFCRQAVGHWEERFQRREDPHGREYVWMFGNFISNEKDYTDCDEWALENGYVSIVPIGTDYTDRVELENLKNNIEF